MSSPTNGDATVAFQAQHDLPGLFQVSSKVQVSSRSLPGLSRSDPPSIVSPGHSKDGKQALLSHTDGSAGLAQDVQLVVVTLFSDEPVIARTTFPLMP